MSWTFSPVSFVAGVIAGALFGYSALQGGNTLDTLWPAAESPAASTDQASASSTTSGAVSVVAQPAGAAVTIESVTVPPPGVWIAVRDVGQGGELGNVLGAARVGGPQANVIVPLLRSTLPGTQYAVELYRDNGDGAFDLSTDSVYVDYDTGDRVVAYFTTAK